MCIRDSYIAKPETEQFFGKSIVAYFKDYQNQGYKLINVPAYIDPPLADTANRKWIPELVDVHDSLIHEPWRLSPVEELDLGIKLGSSYPKPIVENSIEKKCARDKIW